MKEEIKLKLDRYEKAKELYGNPNLLIDRLSKLSRHLLISIFNSPNNITSTKYLACLVNQKTIKVSVYLYRLQKVGYIEKHGTSWVLTGLGEAAIPLFEHLDQYPDRL
jgi:hypothetical protein